MTAFEASEELADLAFFALDHALDSVSDGDALVPFVIVEADNGRTLIRFALDTAEEGVEEARRYARDDAGQAMRLALAYDGYLTVDDERSDAVFVEAQERSAEPGVILAQRYRPKGKLKKFQTAGNPAYVGDASLF